MDMLLEMKDISMIFPGVKALDNVTYTLRKGEINALLGENGAGKSTLIKVLSGVYVPTQGNIYMDGKEVRIHTPFDAQQLGIGTIHQEFNLFPNLSVLQNIAFSLHLVPFSGKILPWKKIRKHVEEILDVMEISLPLDTKIKYLTVANQQLVEIAKALMLNVKILIMDEPTAALTNLEVRNLFKVIRTLKQKGVSIIYISHRMEEIFDLADSITVLRDGKLICSKDRGDVSEKEISRMITGQDLQLNIRDRQRGKRRFGDVKLRVRNLTMVPGYSDISFEVKKGEILGFLGPLGAGKTEIGTTLFGIRQPQSGIIELDGISVRMKSPYDALQKKIAYISEDRKKTGILTNMSVRENITISFLLHNRTWRIHKKEQRDVTEKYIDALKVKTPSQEQNINYLSGGNQQKAIIGRSLATDPEVLILDQPTRGLDIGAKEEIRKLLYRLADDGMAVIVATMEVPEAMELCDRVAIIKGGRIREVVDPMQMTVEELTEKMLGR